MTTVSLNTYETPLSLSPHFLGIKLRTNGELLIAGSDHNISQRTPASGMQVGLLRLLIYYKLLRSGLKPPCMHIILSLTKAVTGK